MTLASNWTKKETGLTLFCGHWKYPEPYCRIHCSVAFAICPGSLLWKMLGSWMKLWGLSSKQDEPEPLKTNGVKMCYRELLNVWFYFFFFHATVQNLWFPAFAPDSYLIEHVQASNNDKPNHAWKSVVLKAWSRLASSFLWRDHAESFLCPRKAEF